MGSFAALFVLIILGGLAVLAKVAMSDMSETNKRFVFGAAWFTVLVIWAVNSINSHSTQVINPTVSPNPVTITQDSQPVQMGPNTVWMIDRNQGEVTVITRDHDGSFHSSVQSYNTP